VSLLTGRLATVVRLVERFADTYDPYVTERVYAVAYGVAMKSHDPVAVGALATCVYTCVFASGNPPPHILLRDYARGVVERALHLGSAIEVVPDRVRPPYKSVWPTIPTDEDIKPLLPDWSKGSHDSGDLRWSWNRIGSSVMSDDFAYYVIGTNSSSSSRDWLSLTLDEASWEPPPHLEDRLSSLVDEFSDDERIVWKAFESADKAHDAASRSFFSVLFEKPDESEALQSLDCSNLEVLAKELEKARPLEVVEFEERRRDAIAALKGSLTEKHAQQLEESAGQFLVKSVCFRLD